MVLAVILISVLALFEIVIGLASDDEATYTLKGLIVLFRNFPVYWLILAVTVFIPVGIYFLISPLARQISHLQQTFNNVHERMGLIKQFTQHLKQEDYDIDFPVADNEDILGRSLLDLRDTLKVSRDHNQKQRQEEEQRSWLAEGSAHFSEILRTHIHDPEQMSFIVIKDLTKYIGAIQEAFTCLMMLILIAGFSTLPHFLPMTGVNSQISRSNGAMALSGPVPWNKRSFI
jgi:hypothetical protein